jgi:putative GTP pyrophosphokinase
MLEKVAQIKTRSERLSRHLRIEYMVGRITSVHSIIRKAIQKKITADRALDAIEDIVGIRVVVNNLSDVKLLLKELQKLEGLSIYSILNC